MPFRNRKEQPAAPLSGYKLAHPMVSADGTRVGFGGVTLGRATVYGVVADAECAQGVRHRSPSRWCDCGFYCLHSLDDARELACDPDYRYTVLLEVAASGRFMRYERGLRYGHQRITAVRLGRCGCDRPASRFVHAGTGVLGWRRLVGVCANCAGTRPVLTQTEFARLLDGPSVTTDDTAIPYDQLSGTPAAEPELLPLLSAEVALLQARLDEVQRQLDRLTNKAD